MVTAATYHHERFFHTALDLDHLTSTLLHNLAETQWTVRAWAVFPNHYHFLAQSPLQETGARSLPRLISKTHMQAAKAINQRHNSPGRKVWHNYWESLITFEKSFFARLHYVNRNPEHHGFKRPAEHYRWCSASWFAETAPRAFVHTVNSFKIDRLHVPDVDCPVETDTPEPPKKQQHP